MARVQPMSRPVRLFWSGGRTSHINYGDTLSPLLVSILSSKKVRFSGTHDCELLGIGSILERYARHRGRRMLTLNFAAVTVWGSGTIEAQSRRPDIGLANIVSVRGLLTKEKLGLPSSTPVGDPGILADLLLDGKRPGKRYRWGIVPHLNDRNDPKVESLCLRTGSATIIRLDNPDLRFVTNELASCEYIASSSLHGMIAADSLGVPNMRLVAGDRVRGGSWKFDDYASSVPGRTLLTRQLDDALALKDCEPELTFSYAADVDRLKDETLKAFRKIGI